MKRLLWNARKVQMSELNRALNVLDIIIKIGSGTAYDIAAAYRQMHGSKLAIEYLMNRDMMDIVGVKEFQKIRGKHVYDSSIYGLDKYTAYQHSMVLYEELNVLEIMHDKLAKKQTANEGITMNDPKLKANAFKGGRTKQFHGRVTWDELARLMAVVEDSGLSLSDWVMSQVRIKEGERIRTNKRIMREQTNMD